MGEVSGAKMAAAAPELAAEDRNGIPTQAVLCLEPAAYVCGRPTSVWPPSPLTIHAAIVDLRRATRR